MAEDALLIYYERELTFFRQMGAEFAAKYPKIASRLLLEEEKCEDPHVERLIQGFAFLSARVQHKLDDEFPEITDALLNVLYPHFLAPVPSMSIAQFVLDPDQGNLTRGYHIPTGSALYSAPVQGAPCRFRTCYPVTLWPFKVSAAQLDAPDRVGSAPKAASAIRLELRCVGGAVLSELAIEHVRFFLDGEGPFVHALYELLFGHVTQVHLRPLDDPKAKSIVLRPDCLRAVGFGPDEGMLPYTARSFLGYRLLQEYFAFPDKFLFFDLYGLEQAARAKFREGVEILLFLDKTPRLEQPLRPETFRLGCAPIVNLFSQVAEPIRLTHTETEYRVIPDVGHQESTEVYAVDSVTSISPYESALTAFEPFYSFKHAAEREQQQAFWYAVRRPSSRKGDAGTEVYLSLVDLKFRPTLPSAETLTLHVTCTNRDLPAKLPFGGVSGNLTIQGAAPLSRITCLRKPTEAVRPSLRRGAQWRLISHLSLNYLSLCEGGKDALQEILKLYDFSSSNVVNQQINGITNLSSRRIVARPASMPWNGFCRGLEVTIRFDEEKYVGSGVFLFATVLEKFLGLYTSLNSFTQLVARTVQREEPLKRWPPRAGEQILL